MRYLYKGSSITRTTIGGKDVALVPNQEVEISDINNNDYLESLHEQRLLVKAEDEHLDEE